MANNSGMKSNFQPIEELQTWVREVRGRNLLLARALGIQPPTVSDWVIGKKRIPLDKVRPIETFTQGAVTRRHMRPNDYLIHWPELAEAQAQTAPPAIKSIAQAEAAIQEAAAKIEHAVEQLCRKDAPWDGNERRGAHQAEADAGQGA